MAMDRGGTGTSQGSSSNQKGGSGEGSKSSSSGGGSKSQGSTANNRSGNSSGGSSASKGSSSSSSSNKGLSSSASAAGSPSSKASSSSTKSGSVGAGKTGGNLAGGNGLAGSDNATTSSTKQDNTKKGVASRVSSVNQTLSSYGSAPSYARAGYGDTLNSQRQQAEVNKQGGNNSISSIGGPSMYGMNDGSLAGKVGGAIGDGLSTNFNDTIKTDNVNGVIGNLQRKAQSGSLTESDRTNIADVSGAYGKQAGANIVGGTLFGGVGKALAGVVGDIGNRDSYFSGIGRDAANGDLDSSRLDGQRGKQLGSDGGLDSALKVGMGLLSGAMPGSGLVLSGAANGLTQPASGFGEVLSQLNDQAGNTVNKWSGQIGNGSGKDYLAPPRQSLASTGQGESSLAFDSSYYDPSRFNVTTGKRGY